MTETRFDLRAKVAEVKSLLMSGKITYDEAHEMLAPAVEEANKRAEVIAKRFKKRPHKFSIVGLLR